MYRTKILFVLAIVVMAASFGSAGMAQGPGGPPPGGPGGFQPSPAMQASFEAWRTWRESHPNVNSLGRVARGLNDLQSDATTKLNPAQSKKLLAVFTKWRNKPVMSETQAGEVSKQITSTLNPAQKAKLTADESQRFGGFGGRPGGGPGGPGGPGGRPGGFGGGPGGPGGPPRMGGGPGGPGGSPPVMPKPHDYNPLNPATLPFERMRPRATQALDDLMTSLKAAH